jgi:hypothetical protein
MPRALPLAWIALLCPALSAHAAPAPHCPVTSPPADSRNGDPLEFMHGRNSLHVWLPRDGRWAASTQTLRWYYKGAPAPTGKPPSPIKITAARLHGEGPPAIVGRPRTIMADEQAAAMLTEIDLPPGCWRVTARYSADVLSFVVEVG